MAIYKFRVSFEEFDDTYRDIEIKSIRLSSTLYFDSGINWV